MKNEKAENKSPAGLPKEDNKLPSDDGDYGDEYGNDEGDDEGEGLMDDEQLADDNGCDQYETYKYEKRIKDYYDKSDDDMEENLEDEEAESDIEDQYIKQKNHIDQLK